MKQTIEIEVPDGKKAVWEDNKIVFEDIKPPLPKAWKEFCKQNNINKNKEEAFIHTSGEIETIKKGECYLDASSSIRELEISKRNKHTDKNILPNKQVAEQHLALMQLHQLRDCYRQGWIPNYTDISKKWYITKLKNKLYIDSISSYSAFLSFQTKELAEQFLTNFKDLIEQAGDLI